VRKLMWFTLGFGAASAFCAYYYVPWLWIAAMAALVLAVGVLVGMRWFSALRIGAAIALGIAVGIVWFLAYDGLYLNEARAIDGKTRSARIEITDHSFETDYGSGFDGAVSLNGRSYNVRGYLNGRWELQPGDILSGEFEFRLTTDGGRKEPTFHRGKGIFLIVYQRSECTVTAAEEIAPVHYPAIWRQQLTQIIENSLPSDVSGFAKALLLGDRTDIDYETSTSFKVSGISHVIAVSGLHVAILFGLIYLITARRRLLTAVIGIPTVLIFAAIAGFSPSVVRASIMQCLVMAAMLFDREYDPPTSLAFAALVMLTVNPLVITSVSFQLSVGCMAGIFLFSERIRGWLMEDKRLGRWNGRITWWAASSVSVTLSAMVFTTPLVAVYFGAVSLVGIVTNLLTLWVITFIFYGVMLVCAVGCFSTGIAALLGWLVAWPIRYVLTVAGWLAELPLAAVYTKSVYIVMWLVFCYGLLVVFLCVRKKQPLLFGCAGIVGLILAVLLSWAEPMLDECRVTALDVGQGQCILLQSEGRTFIVDCGGSHSEDAADIAAETLLSQGISRVDGIILTHYDTDHVGGTEYLLSRIDTDTLFLPFVEDPDGTADVLSQLVGQGTQTVREDTLLTYGDTKLTIFAPVSYKSGNESSMCVLFQTKNCDILITGDRDIRTEGILLRHTNLPKLEVLIVGHHGARNSSGPDLLAATRPEFVLISVGANNPYGHPAQEVLDRLAEYDCKILRTDQYGTIVFRR